MKGGTFLIEKIKPRKRGQPYRYVYYINDSVNDRGILETVIISLVFGSIFGSHNLTDILSTIYSPGRIPKNTDDIEKFLHFFVLGEKKLFNGKTIVDLINELSESKRNEILEKYRSIVELRTIHLRESRPGNKDYNRHKKKLDQFKKLLENFEQGSKLSNTTKSTRKNSNSKVRANTTRALNLY